MFTYLIISHESHFHLQVMAHIRLQLTFTVQNKHTKYQISFHFKALVTSFDFCKQCHHYLQVYVAANKASEDDPSVHDEAKNFFHRMEQGKT